MPRVTKVITSFPSNDFAFSFYAKTILQSVKTNPKFPDLNDPPPATPDSEIPTWLQVNAAVNDFDTQLIKVLMGSTPADTALKNDLRRVLDAPLTGMLVLWAGYVQIQSGGNITDMRSSGFKTSKQPEPTGPLPQPNNFKVLATSVGKLELSIDPVKGAYSYQWEIQQVGSAEPKTVRTTTATILELKDLQSTKQYTCCVVPIGTDGTSTYSEEITSTVL